MLFTDVFMLYVYKRLTLCSLVLADVLDNSFLGRLSFSELYTSSMPIFQTNPHVREALYSGDEDLRSDALALICNTLKKAGI